MCLHHLSTFTLRVCINTPQGQDHHVAEEASSEGCSADLQTLVHLFPFYLSPVPDITAWYIKKKKNTSKPTHNPNTTQSLSSYYKKTKSASEKVHHPP